MRYVRSRDPSPGCVRKARLPSCHQGTPTPVLAFLPTYWASSPCQPVPIEGGAHSVAGSLALGGEQAMLAGAISRGLLLLQVAVTAALAVGLVPPTGAQASIAHPGVRALQTVTMRLYPVASARVHGTALLTAVDGGTRVGLDVRGLPPGARAVSLLHGGTCSHFGASVTVVVALRGGTPGQARRWTPARAPHTGAPTSSSQPPFLRFPPL